MEIEIWLGQLWEFYLARDREGTAGQVAVEAFEMQNVARKRHPRMKSADRGERRIGEPRHIDADIASTSQNGFCDRAVDVDVERHVPIELGDARKELPEKIHRAPRQLDLGGQRRVLIEPLFLDHLRNVEGNIAGDQHGLDFRLL